MESGLDYVFYTQVVRNQDRGGAGGGGGSGAAKRDNNRLITSDFQGSAFGLRQDVPPQERLEPIPADHQRVHPISPVNRLLKY